MVRIAVLGLSLIVVGVDAGWAQDIAGIEDCTKTSGLDKRTGCLQSNVNFLHRLVTKNALDARQKPDAAVSPRHTIPARGKLEDCKLLSIALPVDSSARRQGDRMNGTDVAYGHFGDIARSRMDVRFRRKSGRAADITSMTEFARFGHCQLHF
jgi:hypothetical protein